MATWSTQSKNSSSYTTQNKSQAGQILAVAGQVMGMLCNSYSGGQVLVQGHLPVFTNQSKS